MRNSSHTLIRSLIASSCVLSATGSSATVISATAPELTSHTHVLEALFMPYEIPAAEAIISALISGTFGNSSISNTAPINVFFGGVFDPFIVGDFVGKVQVASCPPNALCTGSPTPTPWSHDFDPSEFSALASLVSDGEHQGNFLSVTTINMSSGKVLGETTLVIVTEPVPEPATAVLIGAGIAMLSLTRRLRREARRATRRIWTPPTS